MKEQAAHVLSKTMPCDALLRPTVCGQPTTEDDPDEDDDAHDGRAIRGHVKCFCKYILMSMYYANFCCFEKLN